MIVWMINMTITNNFPGATMRPCFNGYQLQSKFKDHQNIIWLFIKSRDDPKMLHNYPEKKDWKMIEIPPDRLQVQLNIFFSIDDLWHDSWQLVEVLRNTEKKIWEELSLFLAGSDSSTSQYCEIIQNKLALLQRTWHEYLSEKCPKFSQWNSAPCSSPSLSCSLRFRRSQQGEGMKLQIFRRIISIIMGSILLSPAFCTPLWSTVPGDRKSINNICFTHSFSRNGHPYLKSNFF